MPGCGCVWSWCIGSGHPSLPLGRPLGAFSRAAALKTSLSLSTRALSPTEEILARLWVCALPFHWNSLHVFRFSATNFCRQVPSLVVLNWVFAESGFFVCSSAGFWCFVWLWGGLALAQALGNGFFFFAGSIWERCILSLLQSMFLRVSVSFFLKFFFEYSCLPVRWVCLPSRFGDQVSFSGGRGGGEEEEGRWTTSLSARRRLEEQGWHSQISKCRNPNLRSTVAAVSAT